MLTVKKVYEKIKALQKDGGPEFEPNYSFEGENGHEIKISNEELDHIMVNNSQEDEKLNLITFQAFKFLDKSNNKSWTVVEIRKDFYFILTELGYVAITDERSFKNSDVNFVYLKDIVGVYKNYPMFKNLIIYIITKIVSNVFFYNDNYVLSNKEKKSMINEFDKNMELFVEIMNERYGNGISIINFVINDYVKHIEGQLVEKLIGANYNGVTQPFSFKVESNTKFSIERNIKDRDKSFSFNLSIDFVTLIMSCNICYKNSNSYNNIVYTSFKDLFNDFYSLTKMENKDLLKSISPLLYKVIYGGEYERKE